MKTLVEGTLDGINLSHTILIKATSEELYHCLLGAAVMS